MLCWPVWPTCAAAVRRTATGGGVLGGCHDKAGPAALTFLINLVVQ